MYTRPIFGNAAITNMNIDRMIYVDETKWINSNDARLNSDQQFNKTQVTQACYTPIPGKTQQPYQQTVCIDGLSHACVLRKRHSS